MHSEGRKGFSCKTLAFSNSSAALSSKGMAFSCIISSIHDCIVKCAVLLKEQESCFNPNVCEENSWIIIWYLEQKFLKNKIQFDQN